MKDTVNNGRNNGLDVLKFLCAFFVICIHATFSWREYIEPLTRVAVPVFFIISGYFYPRDSARQKKQIIKILKILMFSCLFYVVWGIVKTLLEHGSVKALLQSWFTVKNLLRFGLFNSVPFIGHLWYLSALLYVHLVFYVVGEKGIRYIFLLCPALLIGLIILGSYSPLIFGKKIAPIFSRNFFFTGLPFFACGYKAQKEAYRLKKIRILPAALFFAVVTVMESRWIRARTGYADMDFYLSTAFLAVSLFALAKQDNLFLQSNLAKKTAGWGRRYSLGIYILHPFVLELLYIFLSKVFGSCTWFLNLYYHTSPMIILAFSILLTECMKYTQKKMRLSEGK